MLEMLHIYACTHTCNSRMKLLKTMHLNSEFQIHLTRNTLYKPEMKANHLATRLNQSQKKRSC